MCFTCAVAAADRKVAALEAIPTLKEFVPFKLGVRGHFFIRALNSVLRENPKWNTSVGEPECDKGRIETRLIAQAAGVPEEK